MRRTFLTALAVLVCFLYMAEVRGQELPTTANTSSSATARRQMSTLPADGGTQNA